MGTKKKDYISACGVCVCLAVIEDILPME